VPHGGQVEQFGERVLVAWTTAIAAPARWPTRCRCCAIAREVHLRLWRHPGEADGTLLQERLVGVQRWLKRQDVAVQAQLVTSDVPPAEAILHSAQTLSADLVVMGVYGHARWAERIIGGVSRRRWRARVVPLLMSH
jgi:nucleotide-binding universal stress UspA family protein